MTTVSYPPRGPGEIHAIDATPLQTVVFWTGEAAAAMAKADLLHDTLPPRESDEGPEARKACASLSRVALANLADLETAVARAQEAYQNLVTAVEGGGI